MIVFSWNFIPYRLANSNRGYTFSILSFFKCDGQFRKGNQIEVERILFSEVNAEILIRRITSCVFYLWSNCDNKAEKNWHNPKSLSTLQNGSRYKVFDSERQFWFLRNKITKLTQQILQTHTQNNFWAFKFRAQNVFKLFEKYIYPWF